MRYLLEDGISPHWNSSFFSSCLLSFLGVFLIARNRPKIKQQDRNFIAMDRIPGKSLISSARSCVPRAEPARTQRGSIRQQWRYDSAGADPGFTLTASVCSPGSRVRLMSCAVRVHRDEAHRQSAARGKDSDIRIAGSQTHVQQSWPSRRFIGTRSICQDCDFVDFFCVCVLAFFLGTSVISLFIEGSGRHQFRLSSSVRGHIGLFCQRIFLRI